MKTEAMTAAMKLLELKIINEQQCAELIVKSMNGHAQAAMATQPALPFKRIVRNKLNIEQIQAVVDMTLIGHPRQVVADTMNTRYGLRMTRAAISTVITDILDGSKRTAKRYNTAEWQGAFDRWEIALKAAS